MRVIIAFLCEDENNTMRRGIVDAREIGELLEQCPRVGGMRWDLYAGGRLALDGHTDRPAIVSGGRQHMWVLMLAGVMNGMSLMIFLMASIFPVKQETKNGREDIRVLRRVDKVLCGRLGEWESP